MISNKSVVVAACNRTLVLAFAHFHLTNVLKLMTHTNMLCQISGKLYRKEFDRKEVQHSESFVAIRPDHRSFLKHYQSA